MDDVCVIGGGIVGLAVAREFTLRGRRVRVLEKERTLAGHQTGHNSGVVHAGLYYPPGSLKAALCARGRRMLKEYCEERDIPYRELGKVVVATVPAEMPALRRIDERARSAGVEGLRRLDAAGIHEVEPHVVGIAGLHSPRTAVVDFPTVTKAMAADVVSGGGSVRTGEEVTAIEQRADSVRLTTASGQVTARKVVACAGLQSDRVARLASASPDPAIIGFRGGYHRLTPSARRLVRGLVYPVPDPRYPFLGIHLTRRVDDDVLVGPNAVLALGREAYGRWDVSLRDLAESVRWPGIRPMAREHWRMGLREMRTTLSARAFLTEARRYVPELRRQDLLPAEAGIRAQAVGRDGSLVDDFRVDVHDGVVLVRNAPSPAATSSLAIAEHIVAALDVD